MTGNVKENRKANFAVRAATAEDTDFILSLVPRFVAFELPEGRRKHEVAAAIRADVERALRSGREVDHFFVADDTNREPIGFLHLQIQRDFFSGQRACHVSDIAVATGHEGAGVGRGLLEYSRQWARRHRCRLLTLAVFPGNARARALYERNGFVPDLLRMVKRVKEP